MLLCKHYEPNIPYKTGNFDLGKKKTFATVNSRSNFGRMKVGRNTVIYLHVFANKDNAHFISHIFISINQICNPSDYSRTLDT